MPKLKFTKKEEATESAPVEEASDAVIGKDIEGSIEESEAQKENENLQKQRDEAVDKMQRLAAEFDNFRKRTMKEKASMYDDGAKDTLEKILPVLDNIERAVADASKANADDSITKGVSMILKQFNEILSSLGVSEIEAMGGQFDPNLHFAVAHEEKEDLGANEITEVMQKGYKYKDKVLRYSMVKVVN